MGLWDDVWACGMMYGPVGWCMCQLGNIWASWVMHIWASGVVYGPVGCCMCDMWAAHNGHVG